MSRKPDDVQAVIDAANDAMFAAFGQSKRWRSIVRGKHTAAELEEFARGITATAEAARKCAVLVETWLATRESAWTLVAPWLESAGYWRKVRRLWEDLVSRERNKGKRGRKPRGGDRGQMALRFAG